jgi:hypothetical protein
MLAGGLLILLPGSTPATHTLTADCGLVNCGAALPAPVTAASAAASPSPLPRHRPYHPAPVPRPAPLVTSTPPAAGPPPAAVTISYSGSSHGNSGHFSTQLTIANHGSTPVSRWTLQLSYPGDQVFWVGYPVGWPGSEFVSWQFGADTLTLSAPAGGETLAPGAAQTILVIGDGNSPAPAGCTFNGTACGS